MKHAWPIAMLIALTLASALAGCSSPVAGRSPSSPDGSAPAVGSGSTATAPSSDGSSTPALSGVDLTVWEPNTMADAYKTMFADFEKSTGAHFDQVVFPDPFESNLLTKWATGARPDLMVYQSSTSWMQKLNPAKNLLDLSDQDFVAKQLFNLGKYAAVVNGRNYGLTLEPPSVFGLWYNKTILARYGVSAPSNFEQLLSACQALKSKAPQISPLYDAGGDQWTTQILPFMLWADAMKSGLQDKLNGNQATWTDPAVVESITDYETLITKGCFNSDLKTGTYVKQEAGFEGGQVAMIAQGTWVSPDFVKAVGVDNMNKSMAWQALSSRTATASYSTTFSLEVPRTGDPTRQQAVLSFLHYAEGPAYQKFVDTQKQAPTLRGFSTPAQVPAALESAYRALQGDGTSYPQLFAADFGPLTTFLSQLINGTATPEQVANSMQTAWIKSAKAIGLRGF